jgi:Icc-related predicted phosphoesterase
VRVAVISDLNGSYGSTDYRPSVSAAIDRIIEIKPDLVISTGDMVAGQRRPHLSEAELRAMWRAFHATVTERLQEAGIPLAVTPGNHDASAYPGFELERRVYAEEWEGRIPVARLVKGSTYPFYYAFDVGPARFVSLDVTTVGEVSATQMQWLRQATQGGRAQIVFSHLPLWPFAIGRETEVIGDRDLERLFLDMGVDLHLSGHHHAFYPGVVDDLAVVSQACLGSGPRRLIGAKEKSDIAITLLEITAQGAIEVSAVRGPRFTDPIAVSDLPRSIQSPLRVIKRLDISPTRQVQWQTGLRATSE